MSLALRTILLLLLLRLPRYVSLRLRLLLFTLHSTTPLLLALTGLTTATSVTRLLLSMQQLQPVIHSLTQLSFLKLPTPRRSFLPALGQALFMFLRPRLGLLPTQLSLQRLKHGRLSLPRHPFPWIPLLG